MSQLPPRSVFWQATLEALLERLARAEAMATLTSGEAHERHEIERRLVESELVTLLVAIKRAGGKVVLYDC